MESLPKAHLPRIRIPMRPLDYALEILAVFGLLALVGITTFYYKRLPAQPLSDYGFQNQLFGFGSKNTLCLLAALGLALYIFMTLVNRRPEKFNYLVEITPENASNQYTLVTKVIRILKAFVMLLFSFLIWRNIGILMGKTQVQSIWLLPVVMAVTLGATFFYILKSTAQK